MMPTFNKGFHISLDDFMGSIDGEDLLLKHQVQLLSKLLSLNLNGSDISEKALITVLQKCDRLESLNLSCCNSILLSGKTLIAGLSGITLRKLKSLNLSSLHHLTDATMTAFIKACPNLQDLYLASVPMTFGSLSQVIGRTNERPSSASLTFDCFLHLIEGMSTTLISINLSRTSITDKCLAKFAIVDQLKLNSIALVSCKDISSEGLKVFISNQKYLQELDLGFNPQLGESSLMSIVEGLPELKKLNFQNVNLNNSAVKALERLSLEHLVLANSLRGGLPENHSDSVFRRWGSKIKRLDLSHCAGLSRKSLVSLSNFLINLTGLNLSSCTNLSDDSLTSISKNLRNLTELSIAWCNKVTDAGLLGVPSHTQDEDGLCKCMRAQQNNMPYFTSVPPIKDIAPREVLPTVHELAGSLCRFQGHAAPLTLLSNLTYLDLSCCTKLTDLSLGAVIAFNNLTYLNLSNVWRLSDVGLRMLAAHNPLLEKVYLKDCKNITDSGFRALITTCRRLSHLSISNCVLITDDSILLLVKQRICLKFLDVSYCSVSSDAIEYLENQMPTLKTIHKRCTAITQ